MDDKVNATPRAASSAPTGTTIGFMGLGQMGRQMATRLGQAGFALRVWNRTPARAQGLPGAIVCASPREAATGADIVVTSLADDQSVREVVLGENGVLAGLGEQAPHIGTSTISHQLAAALTEAHAARGRAFVATPVLGRPDAAGRGELWLLTGGDAAIIARCQPVLQVLGRGQFHMGTQAQALLAKIAANFMIAGTIELLGEVTALGAKGGIAPADLVNMLSKTLFGSPVVNGYGARIAAAEYQPAGFRMALGLKDIELAQACGHDLRVPLPVAGVVRDHILEALARGHDGWDWAGLADMAHAAAGLR